MEGSTEDSGGSAFPGSVYLGMNERLYGSGGLTLAATVGLSENLGITVLGGDLVVDPLGIGAIFIP